MYTDAMSLVLSSKRPWIEPGACEECVNKGLKIRRFLIGNFMHTIIYILKLISFAVVLIVSKYGTSFSARGEQSQCSQRVYHELIICLVGWVDLVLRVLPPGC